MRPSADWRHPLSQPAPPAALAATAPTNQEVSLAQERLVQEWTQCREAIGHFDSLLEDLRKYGFTLITGLLTAGTFLGTKVPSPVAGIAATLAVMMLIAALFCIDTFYVAVQSAAVERALDLELNSNPYIRLTRTVNNNAMATLSFYLAPFMYLLLFLLAIGLGVGISVPFQSVVPSIILLLAGVVIFGFMWVYWIDLRASTHFDVRKDRTWPDGDPPPPATMLAKYGTSVTGLIDKVSRPSGTPPR